MTIPTQPAATRRTFLAAAVAGGASMTPGFDAVVRHPVTVV